MLRTDGIFEIYQIQHYQAGGTAEAKGKWIGSNIDHFAKPEMNNCMRASGQCWQETGETGTFDADRALTLCHRIAKNNPGMRFRVVKRFVKQVTSVYAEVSVEAASTTDAGVVG